MEDICKNMNSEGHLKTSRARGRGYFILLSLILTQSLANIYPVFYVSLNFRKLNTGGREEVVRLQVAAGLVISRSDIFFL